MRSLLAAGAAGAPFAHLRGPKARSAGRAARAEETPEKDKDEDAKKAKKVEDEDPDKKDPDAKAKAKGEEGDPPKDDDKDKDGKKAKKAKAEGDNEDEDDDEKLEDEDCEEEEDDDDEIAAAARSGRRAATARCKNIFASKAAGVRPDMAAHLAFNTNLPGPQAIALLKQMVVGAPAPAAARGSGLYDAMASRRTPTVGSDGGKSPTGGAADFATQMKAAVNKARPGR